MTKSKETAEEKKETATIVLFLKKVTPDWSKVSTYFVILVISGIGVLLATSFEPPKSKEVNDAQNIIIQQHEERLSKMDKKAVIDSVNNHYTKKTLKQIGKKLGLSDDELSE